MKVIILAGGLGTRLSEYTDSIPKPMIPIGGKPMLWHIINLYLKYNHKDFFIATGYKNEIIEKYFSENLEKWNINRNNYKEKTTSIWWIEGYGF